MLFAHEELAIKFGDEVADQITTVQDFLRENYGSEEWGKLLSMMQVILLAQLLMQIEKFVVNEELRLSSSTSINTREEE